MFHAFLALLSIVVAIRNPWIWPLVMPTIPFCAIGALWQ